MAEPLDVNQAPIADGSAKSACKCRLPANGETCGCVVCGQDREVASLRRRCNELEAAAAREKAQSRILRELFEDKRARVARANQIVAEAWRQRDAAWRERDFLVATAIGIDVTPVRSENPYWTADGKAIVLGETEVWTRERGTGKPLRLGICYSVTRGIRLGDTLYVFAGGSMATPVEQCYSSEQAVLAAIRNEDASRE